MGRAIDSRIVIQGFLEARTPIHVGGNGGDFETDMALAKNGRDDYYVPGTSVSGVLRQWFVDCFPDDVRAIWGYQEKDQGHASFVIVDDLTIENSVVPEMRDGVGIDRRYGSAAGRIKYDRMTLPKGTTFRFKLTVDIGDSSKAARITAMTGRLVQALKNGEIRLGASKTRGLGKIILNEGVTLRVQSFSTFDGIIAACRGGGKDVCIKHLIDADSSVDSNDLQRLDITVKWRPASPLMVKAGFNGIGVDTLPLTSSKGDGTVSLVLPGSSIKGVFRAQAERIIRTFSEKSLTDSEFGDQIKVDLVNELFGAKKESAVKETGAKAASAVNEKLGRGALSIDDCFAELSMAAKEWGDVESGTFDNETSYFSAGLHRALKAIDGEPEQLHEATNAFRVSHHTAVDRFTGAASDGALFSVLKPSPEANWDDITISVDLRRLRRQFESEAKQGGESDTNDSKENDLVLCSLMLLLLVLRDFANNRLPLGFAVNRGMGEVKEVSFRISGAFDFSYENGKFKFKDENLLNKMQKAWEVVEL